MKSLYITAVVTFSGKTALALGIGLKVLGMGKHVGYLKPISTQPIMLEGKLVDEDAEFVGRTLGLGVPATDLSTVVIDDAMLDKLIQGQTKRDFAAEIKAAFDKAEPEKDLMIVEGGASMREGYIVGLNSMHLANALDMPTLGVVRYRSNVMLIDDALALKQRMGNHLLGVVINSVPAEAGDQVRGKITAFLEGQGVKVYGVLPHQQALMSLSVGELIEVLNAKKLTPAASDDGLVENLSVGAMSVEAAMPHFRRTLRKAVITGGDRADIQAAALETSTTVLVLTGNMQPSSTILKYAESRGVAVLLVPFNTIEAVERVERIFGKTRLAHPEKLSRFREMLDTHLNWNRLLSDLGL